METESFNVKLTTTVEDGALRWSIEETTGGSLNRYYVEVWSRGGARVDEETFQRYPLVETTFTADPLTVDLDNATSAAERPAVSIVVFENTGGSGQELYRHEHRFFSSCGRWHYVNA